MKKTLLLLIVLIWSAATFAQQGLQVGILGGPQTNWLINKNDSDDPNVKYKTGGPRGFVGASVDYHFSPEAGVGLEFVYSWQGQAYSTYQGAPNAQLNVNYFKIPLLLNFNSNPDHVAMFIGKFGPYLGVNTAANAVVPGFPAADVSSNYEKLNAGMILDLGVGFNIAKVVVLSLAVRLDGQLSDAMNNITATNDPNGFSLYDSSQPGNTASVRQRTWNVAGGLEIGAKYIIPTGKKSHSSYHRR